MFATHGQENNLGLSNTYLVILGTSKIFPEWFCYLTFLPVKYKWPRNSACLLVVGGVTVFHDGHSETMH